MSKQDLEKLRAHDPALVDAVVAHVVRHGLSAMTGWQGVYIRLLCEASKMYQRGNYARAKDNAHAAECVIISCGEDGDAVLVQFSRRCTEFAATSEEMKQRADIAVQLRNIGTPYSQIVHLVRTRREALQHQIATTPITLSDS